MALQLSKTMPTGFVANYWKIDSLVYDANMNIFTVNMSLYADKPAKQAGYQAVWFGPVVFTGISNSDIDNIFKSGNNPINGTYTYLKTQTQFLNALDI